MKYRTPDALRRRHLRSLWQVPMAWQWSVTIVVPGEGKKSEKNTRTYGAAIPNWTSRWKQTSRLRGNMRASIFSLALIFVVMGACAKRVPEPKGIAPGTPHISWVIMSGDRDNPDQDFVCQSDPRNDCVVPASRPDAQVFSDAHFYYHGAGSETKYEGPINIGHFQGSPESYITQTKITVKKGESITKQSVTGIVTSMPGTYAIAFSLVATVADTGKTQPIRDSVPIVVK
jgi:hypothetical protein